MEASMTESGMEDRQVLPLLLGQHARHLDHSPMSPEIRNSHQPELRLAQIMQMYLPCTFYMLETG
jgi:hypothetical protein